MIPIEFKKETYDHMDMKRVFLKLSGEALAGPKKTGFDEDTVKEVARQVKISVDAGVQVGIVIGGGNFWRGRTSDAIERTKADQIGMLATIMNCIYVSEIFRNAGMKTEILTPFVCGAVTELFSKDKANRYFEEGKVVFFAGGTGHPYFSTDTGITLRAVEMDADCILLAKSIDGVYDSDPAKNPDAKRYDTISIQEETMQEHLKLYEDKMEKSLDVLLDEYASIRAGRANPHVLDRLRIDYYGTPTPIQQVGNVTVPEARMIVIQPWEKSLLKEIEKAILVSDLGINPTNDGNVIRLVFPELTEERRKDLAKDVKKKGEGAKVAVRNIRRDAMDSIKKMEKAGDISEDDLKQGEEKIQKITDKMIEKVDKAIEAKTKEIMTV